MVSTACLKFDQKVAIVTGGCDGIGGCVDALVENGGTVVVLDKNGTKGDPEITGLTFCMKSVPNVI